MIFLTVSLGLLMIGSVFAECDKAAIDQCKKTLAFAMVNFPSNKKAVCRLGQTVAFCTERASTGCDPDKRKAMFDQLNKLNEDPINCNIKVHFTEMPLCKVGVNKGYEINHTWTSLTTLSKKREKCVCQRTKSNMQAEIRCGDQKALCRYDIFMEGIKTIESVLFCHGGQDMMTAMCGVKLECGSVEYEHILEEHDKWPRNHAKICSIATNIIYCAKTAYKSCDKAQKRYLVTMLRNIHKTFRKCPKFPILYKELTGEDIPVVEGCSKTRFTQCAKKANKTFYRYKDRTDEDTCLDFQENIDRCLRRKRQACTTDSFEVIQSQLHTLKVQGHECVLKKDYFIIGDYCLAGKKTKEITRMTFEYWDYKDAKGYKYSCYCVYGVTDCALKNGCHWKGEYVPEGGQRNGCTCKEFDLANQQHRFECPEKKTPQPGPEKKTPQPDTRLTRQKPVALEQSEGDTGAGNVQMSREEFKSGSYSTYKNKGPLLFLRLLILTVAWYEV